MGDRIWNRDAVVAERIGFDCSKGHPAMGNYHHHQNPSTFKLDRKNIYDVCNLYDADGLYAINPATHSPLLGFAYDGFPIYGAYAFKNTDGTGDIVRMKSSFQLRAITERTIYADGKDVIDGPPVNATYPLGYFREDYEFVSHPNESDYVDEHNGRFCKTPEYPDGIYAYFCTVDENWNSAYPYVVGPYFYGVKNATKVANIAEAVTTYTPSTSGIQPLGADFKIEVYPNPASDLIAIQVNDLNKENLKINLYDMSGKLVAATVLYQGSTIAYFETEKLYSGEYLITLTNGVDVIHKKVVIIK
jgi:hypothetical protein